MRGKHANIALFVPHVGCPHRCCFCNQHAITGRQRVPASADVRAAAEQALRDLGDRAKTAELAFFGGSFTAIPETYRTELLEAAWPYVRDGRFGGIRISTRPDAVGEDVLAALKAYGVTAVELGAQSMDDAVLTRCGRGHTAQQVREAAARVKAAGFSLGLQMMTGLPGDTPLGALDTARQLIACRPDTVRVYPALVLRNTELSRLYGNHTYRPQTLEEAVSLCAELLRLFEDAGVRVIRMGLHSVEKSEFIAGPWHPAFRELCEGELYYAAALAALQGCSKETEYKIYVNRTAVSKMAGQNRRNLLALEQAGYRCGIGVDDTLQNYQIRLEGRNGACC